MDRRMGYLFRALSSFLASAHAIQSANLNNKVSYSLLSVLRRSVCCAPSRPRSVAYGTDNGSPREFDPIGHILASTSSRGGSHTNFFCESHRSYIEEGKAVVVWIAGQITIYFFIGRGSRTDLKKAYGDVSATEQAAIDLLPLSRSHSFSFFLFCNSLDRMVERQSPRRWAFTECARASSHVVPLRL